jgi:DNA excision repair protein ERCC-1
MTLMLAHSNEECGQIINNYKLYENSSADRIQEKQESESYPQLINALTTIKSVNKTDAMNLISNFKTLENLVEASEHKLNSCLGLGPRKAKQLYEMFNEPFLK